MGWAAINENVRCVGEIPVYVNARRMPVKPAIATQGDSSLESDLNLGPGAECVENVCALAGGGDRMAGNYLAKDNPPGRDSEGFIEYSRGLGSGAANCALDVILEGSGTENEVIATEV